ncbi:LysM peptidoglycan-binding domain-containing protein, partial [Streptococcus sp. DD13]|uniref:LysM peptidoglycan-binding domain-containing protein n=1 Tax=Streptococcus sp. DD13 TaxID=1777881 RepID=UPI0012E75336
MKLSKKFTLKTTILGATAAVTLFVAGVVSADTYTVQSGDTLSVLATKYKTSVDKIVKDNKILNPDLIYVGQTLEIDGKTKANVA